MTHYILVLGEGGFSKVVRAWFSGTPVVGRCRLKPRFESKPAFKF